MKNLLFLGFLFCLLSCKETSFVPATQHVPLFTDKKQWRIEQTINNKSFDVGIAYAPVKHLGTMLNVQSSLYTYSIEPAVGGFVYFKPVVLELYGGYAYVNKQSTHMFEDLVKANMKANRYFVQPSIGFHFTEYTELALSAKASYWAFTKYEYLTDDNNEASFLSIKDMRSFTIEPALTFKAGTDTFKGMTQVGCYFNPNEGPGSPDIYLSEISPWFFKIGCTISVRILPKDGNGTHDNVRFL